MQHSTGRPVLAPPLISLDKLVARLELLKLEIQCAIHPTYELLEKKARLESVSQGFYVTARPLTLSLEHSHPLIPPIRAPDGSRCSDDRWAHPGSIRIVRNANNVQIQQSDLENTCAWRSFPQRFLLVLTRWRKSGRIWPHRNRAGLLPITQVRV